MRKLIVGVLVASLAALSVASCASTSSPAIAQEAVRPQHGACQSALLIFSAVREACAFQQDEGNDVRQQKLRAAQAQAEVMRPGAVAVQNSTRVYSADECVGAIVNGQCHGTILDHGGYHPTCHGEMLNGQCTGPMF